MSPSSLKAKQVNSFQFKLSSKALAIFPQRWLVCMIITASLELKDSQSRLFLCNNAVTGGATTAGPLLSTQLQAEM